MFNALWRRTWALFAVTRTADEISSVQSQRARQDLHKPAICSTGSSGWFQSPCEQQHRPRLWNKGNERQPDQNCGSRVSESLWGCETRLRTGRKGFASISGAITCSTQDRNNPGDSLSCSGDEECSFDAFWTSRYFFLDEIWGACMLVWLGVFLLMQIFASLSRICLQRSILGLNEINEVVCNDFGRPLLPVTWINRSPTCPVESMQIPHILSGYWLGAVSQDGNRFHIKQLQASNQMNAQTAPLPNLPRANLRPVPGVGRHPTAPRPVKTSSNQQGTCFHWNPLIEGSEKIDAKHSPPGRQVVLHFNRRSFIIHKPETQSIYCKSYVITCLKWSSWACWEGTPWCCRDSEAEHHRQKACSGISAFTSTNASDLRNALQPDAGFQRTELGLRTAHPGPKSCCEPLCFAKLECHILIGPKNHKSNMQPCKFLHGSISSWTNRALCITSSYQQWFQCKSDISCALPLQWRPNAMTASSQPYGVQQGSLPQNNQPGSGFQNLGRPHAAGNTLLNNHLGLVAASMQQASTQPASRPSRGFLQSHLAGPSPTSSLQNPAGSMQFSTAQMQPVYQQAVPILQQGSYPTLTGFFPAPGSLPMQQMPAGMWLPQQGQVYGMQNAQSGGVPFSSLPQVMHLRSQVTLIDFNGPDGP